MDYCGIPFILSHGLGEVLQERDAQRWKKIEGGVREMQREVHLRPFRTTKETDRLPKANPVGGLRCRSTPSRFVSFQQKKCLDTKTMQGVDDLKVA